jgi:bifunctional non-homologous end joining protein LigD
MQTEKVELYFQQGSSDKVYHLQLETVQEQWTVQAQWGRRGAALQSDVKANGVTYEEAKRVYERILREKTGKGIKSPKRPLMAIRRLPWDCPPKNTPAMCPSC